MELTLGIAATRRAAERGATAAILLLALAAAARGEPAAELRDGRQGVIEYMSTTPSRPSQLIAGAGTPTAVVGTLVLPAGRAQRGPAMVIAHGSGGIRADREHAWAARLNALGVATFVVDSFTPRGIRSTAADQSRLSTTANMSDALHALRLLATHPAIDPARIGVLGFSKGGQVALYTALEPFRRGVLGDELRFALHVAFYASCSLPYLSRSVTGKPIVLLLGEADDYTPSAHCARYADWFRSKGAPVETIVFADAHHGFDVPSPPRRMAGAQTARSCGLDILLEPVEGRRWSTGERVPAEGIGAYLRGCMERGATFGGHPGALAGALAAVEHAVRAHLK